MKHTEAAIEPFHYVFIEKIGPFMKTAQAAWQALHQQLPNPDNKIGAMALYRFAPEMTYRAGWLLSARPSQLPPDLRYEKIEGGKYAKFTVTGSYSQLPEASGVVWEQAKSLAVREGWAIENYANDPRTTPESELITEIMVPIK